MTEHQESQTQKEKILEKKNIFCYASLVVCLGIILLLVICKLDALYVTNTNEHYMFYRYVQPICNNIADSAIILGLGTLLLDLFGYLSYSRKRISEVFTEQQMVDILNEDYKKELKLNLLKSIYKPNTEDSEKLLSLFDGKLSAIMDTYYYNSYMFFLKCSIISIGDRKYFEKRVDKVVTYKEVNSNKTNTIETIIKIVLCDIEANDQSSEILPFGDVKVKVKDKWLKENEDFIVDPKPYKDDGTGKTKTVYACKFKKPVEIENELNIEFSYKTIAPIEDREYTIHLDHLCKNMRCKFSYDDKDMDVGVKGFNFNTDTKLGFTPLIHKGLCEIESNDWVLPGEGVVFSLFEKKRP